MKNAQQTQTINKNLNRIASLDGLRCVAVISVVFYHYFHALPKQEHLVPYGNFYADLLWAKYGGLGVPLFFAISGFVITQTLHNSTSLTNFTIKRFARLWPTMLLCSLMTFCLSFWGTSVYSSNAHNFLPSLTFLDPVLFKKIFNNNDIAWMDGAYWSLFVEIRFYAIAAIIFFYKKDKFFENFMLFLLVVSLVYSASMYFGLYILRSTLYFLAIANHLPWFAFGIGCYYLYCQKNNKFIALFIASLLSLVAFVLSAINTKYMDFHGERDIIAIFIVFPLMLAAMKISFIKNILSLKPISSIGLASYSIYLLHQNIGEKVIINIGNPFNFNQPSSGLYALVVVATLVLISHLIYVYYENPANRAICKFSTNFLAKNNTLPV